MEKVTYRNDGENVDKHLAFNLHANAFRKGAKYPAISKQNEHYAYYNGESYGLIEITKVTSEKGENLEFNIGGLDQNIKDFLNEVDETFIWEDNNLDDLHRKNLFKLQLMESFKYEMEEGE